ncbi:hypothetical protein BFL43_02630 [Williamsia sp. 1135]|nr:hypothetical protein BFL43_02630 [Williamsia sp. 1135]
MARVTLRPTPIGDIYLLSLAKVWCGVASHRPLTTPGKPGRPDAATVTMTGRAASTLTTPIQREDQELTEGHPGDRTRGDRHAEIIDERPGVVEDVEHVQAGLVERLVLIAAVSLREGARSSR